MASQPIADVDHQNPTVISAEKSSVPQSESTSRDASANADSVARLSEDQNNGDAPVEKVVTGAPLSQVPSQAQKLGKKKVFITIVSTALPTMAAHFHASESGYSWMASAYMLANAACVPLWGKISDIWGRKPIILLANAVFLVASLICALAVNLPMIIAGRALQGIGGGGIIVLANISVSDLFSVRERGMYYGLFGTTWAIAGALGPIIGGAFTTNVTWRWCFYLNLPIGGLSFVILFFFLKIESGKTPLLAGIRAIDWSGTLLIIGGTVMFLFGLEFGGVSYPWASPTVICLIVFGIVTWVIAMLNEWKVARYPVIPLRLFGNWHNCLVLLICFCHSFVFISGAYYLPLYFQTVLLASPILSGVYVLPNVLSLSVVSAATGFIMRKVGRYRELIIGGMLFMTIGYGLFIDLKPYASWPRIIIYQIIGGIGTGPNFQAPLVALQANIHPSDVATATSTFGFLRQTSAAIATVLGTVVYQNVLSQQMPRIAAALGPDNAHAISSGFAGSQSDLIRSLPADQRAVILDAYTFALSRMWIFYTAIAGFGFILTLFVRHIELSKSHTVTKTGLQEQERARQEILAAQRAERQPPEPKEGA
ncbi:hypothetical protein ATERTT37_002893 [Aspergillus terreus]